MRALWTFVVAMIGVLFSGESFYVLSQEPSEVVYWISLVLSVFFAVHADWIVNAIYRRLGPKPMAVRVIGVPPKRFRKGF